MTRDCRRFANDTCPGNDTCSKYYQCRIMHDSRALPEGTKPEDYDDKDFT